MDFPPPAHELMPVPIPGQPIVEVIYSASGAERNFITQDAAGLYRVYQEHWNTYVDDPADSFWCRSGPYNFTDDLAIAQRIASQSFSDSTPDEVA
jgi:hypothetical protein